MQTATSHTHTHRESSAAAILHDPGALTQGDPCVWPTLARSPIGRPRDNEVLQARPGAQACSCGAPRGRRTVNTDPLPGSLVTVTSSPIIRASLRQIARRSPVPPPAERARVALPSRLAARRTVAAQGASGRPSCRLFAYATPAAASIASTIDGSSFPGLGHQLIGIGGDDCKSPNPFA